MFWLCPFLPITLFLNLGDKCPHNNPVEPGPQSRVSSLFRWLEGQPGASHFLDQEEQCQAPGQHSLTTTTFFLVTYVSHLVAGFPGQNSLLHSTGPSVGLVHWVEKSIRQDLGMPSSGDLEGMR